MLNSGGPAGKRLPANLATGEQIFVAAHDGNRDARALLREEARRIAVRIAQITRVADVELVVLGGGIGLACADLIPQIQDALPSQVLSPPKVRISRLGDTPVLLGALARGAKEATQIVTAQGITAIGPISSTTRST